MEWDCNKEIQLKNALDDFFKENGYRIGKGCFCWGWKKTRYILWSLREYIVKKIK